MQHRVVLCNKYLNYNSRSWIELNEAVRAIFLLYLNEVVPICSLLLFPLYTARLYSDSVMLWWYMRLNPTKENSTYRIAFTALSIQNFLIHRLLTTFKVVGPGSFRICNELIAWIRIFNYTNTLWFPFPLCVMWFHSLQHVFRFQIWRSSLSQWNRNTIRCRLLAKMDLDFVKTWKISNFHFKFRRV